jgi:hypothetical protein
MEMTSTTLPSFSMLRIITSSLGTTRAIGYKVRPEMGDSHGGRVGRVGNGGTLV